MKLILKKAFKICIIFPPKENFESIFALCVWGGGGGSEGFNVR